ncbi:MAG TPA: energy transducer TonB [Silvibacterium sp.]|nr:energy transducer TonB [Silvibacterium sp.]
MRQTDDEGAMLEANQTESSGITSPVGRWTSIGAHSVLLALLIIAAHHAWQVRPVSARGEQHATVLYWQGSVGSGVARTHQHGAEKLMPAKMVPRNSPVTPLHEKQLDPDAREATDTAAASPAGSSTSGLQSNGVGEGTQDATPAFPVYSPSPHIERSLLPKTDENVVVDVNVSPLGEVLDEKLIHGLGTSVDQTILDAVRSWKFHPATVDGNAVASVAELVFPLGQKWRG